MSIEFPSDEAIWKELWAERDKVSPSMAWNTKHWYVKCMFDFCTMEDGRSRIENYMTNYGHSFTLSRKRAWVDWHVDNGVTF